MEIVFIVTSSLFFLWIIRQLFFWLWVWQQNDYRYDRFVASFRRNFRKHQLLFVFFPFGKWLLFFLYGYVVFHTEFLVAYQYAIVALYGTLSFFLLREIYFNQLKKPQITLRITILIAVILLVILLLFAIPLLDRFFWLLAIDLLTPMIITTIVLLTSFPIEIYHDSQIEKAGQKIRQFPNLLVIAVTGSVGKSRTKDYLATLLKAKFNVVKTDGKDNTLIGVSQTILRNITNKTDIFVAEISAYKPGEIAMLSELIKPKIGVLTTINSYYLSLFRSMDAIKKTNYELVESLPKDGFCLYNGNSTNTKALYKKSRKGKVLFHVTTTGALPIGNLKEFTAYDVVHTAKRTSFQVAFQGRSIRFSLHQFHHFEALLPAIYIALQLGISEQEIQRKIVHLK